MLRAVRATLIRKNYILAAPFLLPTAKEYNNLRFGMYVATFCMFPSSE